MRPGENRSALFFRLNVAPVTLLGLYLVSARMRFFSVLRFSFNPVSCSFYRKTPHVHAYPNSQTVHHFKMFYI